MTAVLPRCVGVRGRKVRAPPDRVLGNAQALAMDLSVAEDGKWHRNIPPPVSLAEKVGLCLQRGTKPEVRVKSDGKSVRSAAAT